MSDPGSTHPRLLPPLNEEALTDDEVAHIVGHFGLGDLQTRENLTLGYVNWNCAVETTQGRFFLKRRHPALAESDLVDAQHKLIAHIRANGVPTPVVYPTTDGDSCLLHEGHVYEIHEWTAGQRYDDQNPQHLAAVGEMLARYHLAVRDFAPPEPLLRRQGWLYGPAVMERQIQYLESRWPGLDAHWASLREQSARIAEVHPQHAKLSQLVIHGDYYANNILFDGTRIIGLLDYDNAAHQSRIVEAAEALIYFANEPDERLQVGVYDGVVNLDKVSGFMAAYNAVWALEPGEVAVLPATVQAIWLMVSLRRLDERADASREEVLARLKAAQLLADWVTTHRRELAEAASLTR